MIDGVQIKKLITHHDERGYFRELIRATDDFFAAGFGQWSMSLMYSTEVAKAWHLHHIQTDWWYFPLGVARAALYDTRPDSPTFGQTDEYIMDDSCILKIPPGVAHGCKVIQAPAVLMYITSHVYDPADEGRIPHDDPAIGYDWLRGPVIT